MTALPTDAADMRAMLAALARIEGEIRFGNQRLGTLESLVGGIGQEIVAVKVEVAELRGKVGQLPTWWMLLIAIVTIMAATYGMLRP
jgi:hypothetical protein